MTPVGLAWRRLVRRPATMLLNVLLIALGVAAITATLLVVGQANRAGERNAAAVDLVVGAKTSPMQLVLSGIFHLDAPPAPFVLSMVEPALRHPMVKRWVPLALGDSVDGYRIVGTESVAFAALYDGQLRGGAWPTSQHEAVVGADVARDAGLAVGKRFASTHGLSAAGEAHDGEVYRVVGVLERTGTVLDRLVLTSLNSVWQAHAGDDGASGPAGTNDAHGKVSLVLVQFKSPLGAVLLPRLLGFVPGLQVALPAQETAKLFSLVQLGADGSLMLGGCLLACAALAVCAGLLAAHRERVRDVAVLRLLGASPAVTAAVVMLEASLVGLLGAAAGMLSAHTLVEVVSRYLPSAAPPLTGWAFDPLQAWIVLAALVVSWVGAALPAWRVQRAEVADVLKTF
jgi:putative ABC transport system permease protein